MIFAYWDYLEAGVVFETLLETQTLGIMWKQELSWKRCWRLRLLGLSVSRSCLGNVVEDSASWDFLEAGVVFETLLETQILGIIWRRGD